MRWSLWVFCLGDFARGVVARNGSAFIVEKGTDDIWSSCMELHVGKRSSLFFQQAALFFAYFLCRDTAKYP